MSGVRDPVHLFSIRMPAIACWCWVFPNFFKNYFGDHNKTERGIFFIRKARSYKKGMLIVVLSHSFFLQICSEAIKKNEVPGIITFLIKKEKALSTFYLKFVNLAASVPTSIALVIKTKKKFIVLVLGLKKRFSVV